MSASHINEQLFYLIRHAITELCRQKALLSRARRAQEPEHFLYERLQSPLGEQLLQLKSRYPFVLAALELRNDPAQSNTSVAQ